jgi:hypothetical protein
MAFVSGVFRLLCAARRVPGVATKIQVRWSGLLLGVMMVALVAMIYLPRAFARPRDRIAWTIVARELSFAGGGWILAGIAMRSRGGSKLITIGRMLIAVAALFFGVEHFLYSAGCPGVPLEKLTPVWIPGHLLLGYLTGVIRRIAGTSIRLEAKNVRTDTRIIACGEEPDSHFSDIYFRTIERGASSGSVARGPDRDVEAG